MARKKEVVETPVMKKPKFKVGDRVTVEFITSNYEVTLTELYRNPRYPEKWIYRGITDDNLTIPYIGINGSEKFANIYTIDKRKLKKDLESTPE